MENKNTFKSPYSGSFKEAMSSPEFHTEPIENIETTYKPVNKKTAVNIKNLPKFNETEDFTKISLEQPFDLNQLGDIDNRTYKFIRMDPRILAKYGTKTIQWVYKEPGSDVWLEPVKTLPGDELEIINKKINKRVMYGNSKK